MAIYIWLIFHNIVIYCNSAGCLSTSMQHFNYLSGVGALELIFELAGIVKIFTKKGINNGTTKKNREFRNNS